MAVRRTDGGAFSATHHSPTNTRGNTPIPKPQQATQKPQPPPPRTKKPPRDKAMRRWQRKALTKGPNAPPPPLHHRLRAVPLPMPTAQGGTRHETTTQILPVAQRWGGGPLAQRVAEWQWRRRNKGAAVAGPTTARSTPEPPSPPPSKLTTDKNPPCGRRPWGGGSAKR